MVRVLWTVAFLLFLLGNAPANAGIFICNDTGIKLYLAIGYKYKDDWAASGWYAIEPRGCTTPIQGLLINKYYYYYAYGLGISYGGDGNNSFCIDENDKFDYIDVPDCTKRSFIQIDTGNQDQVTINLIENPRDPLKAAEACNQYISDGRDAFAKCWMRQVASVKQRQILDCVENTQSNAALAICASKGYLSDDAAKAAKCAQEYANRKLPRELMNCLADGALSEENARLLRCATNEQTLSAALICAGSNGLTGDQRRMVRCVSDNKGDYAAAGVCLVGNKLSPEEQKLAQCVLSNRGSYIQMGVCAAGDSLTPEQQAFLECAIQSGGQPYVYAGCVGTRLTLNELDKCFTSGIGGNGCFGRNNFIIENYTNAWKDVTKGPGPNNDLVGQDGALITAARNAWNDVTEGPGPNNEVCKLTPLC
jgi:uncharacterized membrane protein